MSVASRASRQGVGDLGDAGPEPLDSPGRERLAHQAPEPGVVGRVGSQQAAHLALDLVAERRLELPQRLRHGLGRLDEAVVSQNGAHVVIPGHDPRLEPLLADPVDGGGVAQLRQQRIGIGADRVVIEVQRHRLGHRCCLYHDTAPARPR